MGSVKLSLNGIYKTVQSITTPVLKTCSRNVSTTFYKSGRTFKRKGEEVKIPTPWGHIAGVWWGPRDRQPVLALHGWQDNAYTWRPLMELLPQDVAVLAIDFPGHGLSSRYPNGVFYHSPDNIVNVRRVVKHFGWKSVSLMGHSMGAIASFAYASFFPNEINFTIHLDNIKPIITRRRNSIQYVADSIDHLLVADERNIAESEPPAYEEPELVQRLHQMLGNSIDKESCPILFDRGAIQSEKDPSKFFYSRDSRLKYSMTLGLSEEDTHVMARRLHSPMMAIKFAEGILFEPKDKSDKIIALLKANNPLFEEHTIPGTHHSHLNNPELVAPLIIDFLQRYYK